MSDDFKWQPDSLTGRHAIGLRVTVVLTCAGLGILAGSIYPIKLVLDQLAVANPPAQDLVMMAIERNWPSPSNGDPPQAQHCHRNATSPNGARALHS